MFVAERDLFNPRGAGKKKCRREAATSQTSLQRLAAKELISSLAAIGAGAVVAGSDGEEDWDGPAGRNELIVLGWGLYGRVSAEGSFGEVAVVVRSYVCLLRI